MSLDLGGPTRLTSGLDLLADLRDSDLDRPALHGTGGEVSYRELDRRVSRRALALRARPTDGLHRVQPGRDVESVVELLAAWRAGRVVLMVPPGDAGVRLLEHWPEQAPRQHEVHPELALLMSTSGTTGSPTLVRLSHDNLRSNARAIVDYLGITADDVALSTLPLHYCYGLSVLTSHLLARACVVLREESVTRPDLWRQARECAVTSFAGVPHTFDLIDRAGVELPSTLRYATQAGGTLAPEDVRSWSRRLARQGADLVLMYGQTEATARMAWLPPHLLERHPDAVGVAIPGGELRVDPLPGLDDALGDAVPPDAGELVYVGPNVMLGYARGAEDLARGAELAELRTGDLGVREPDGVVRVVGRLARFAKVLGLRVDLDGCERSLAQHGIRARVLEHEAGLAVFVEGSEGPGRAAEVRGRLAEFAGIPAHALSVRGVERLPRSEQGKRDDAPLRALLLDPAPADAAGAAGSRAEQVRAAYASILARPDATLDDSFVSLRGDSLSFVEANVRLAALLGEVPADWPRLTPRELGATAPSPGPERTAGRSRPRRRRAWPTVDTAMVLRAVAIVLVVGSHTDVWMLPGGSHTLLALVGFSLVRFHLNGTSNAGAPGRGSGGPRGRSGRVVSMLVKIVVPAFLVTASVLVLRGTYEPTTLLGLNNLLGSERWTDQWRLWFIEAIAWGLLVVALALRVPLLDRWERRAPYGVPLLLLVASLAARWWEIGWQADNPQRYSLPFVWTFLLLGWLAARSGTPRLRVLTTALAALSTLGFFGDPVREGIVLAALVSLTWVPRVRLPARLVAPVGVVAASSLWVYLVHWEVYPPVEEVSEPLALLVSFASGIAAWWAWTRLTRRSRTLRWVG